MAHVVGIDGAASARGQVAHEQVVVLGHDAHRVVAGWHYEHLPVLAVAAVGPEPEMVVLRNFVPE